jgi:undecaprenyl pyrophosphate synthase
VQSVLTSNDFTVQSETLRGLHVAIIMDGNGRWAEGRNLPRVAGIEPEWRPYGALWSTPRMWALDA